LQNIIVSLENLRNPKWYILAKSRYVEVSNIIVLSNI
jgi:hypothetical protein